MTTHKEWLDNEYQLWIKALQESTVHNFKENEMVERMLGWIPVTLPWGFSPEEDPTLFRLLMKIDSIGYSANTFTGVAMRMIYYARKVLEINPPAIIEIGAGVGEFYAILRALGYKGSYWIYDLPEVKKFQRQYLDEVTKRTGLNTSLSLPYVGDCFLVSFYAFGEFDDKTKDDYLETVFPMCNHGLILWNPHSGATQEVPFACKVEEEYPLTAPNNKMLTW